jgi:DNA-binding CsgD family transcriptional regulator/tetratricopeptide (TPR) repeat protein
MRHVIGGLVEREQELAALEAALTEASAGRARVVLVTAEAGGGKTALIDRFCADRIGSTRVLRGACDALFTPRPLGPIQDFAADVGPELESRLLGEAIPYEVAASLIDELRRRTPTVLVVEDIHWADAATQDVLRLVLRRTAAERVLIVLSYRDEALDARHPVRVMLGELATALSFTRMPLASLSPEAVAQIADPYDVEPLDLHRVTAGNPFFVTEVLASGRSEAIPATVRDAVLARAARLSTDARALLGAIAIAPPHVELWLLDALAREHVSALEECLSSGMLVQPAAGAIAFRHELARLAIEESLEPRRRLALHCMALAALAEPPAGRPDAARLAHHADAAGDADAVLRFAPAAAESAAAVGAHREAAAQCARALRFGERLSPGERGDLLRRRAVSCLLIDQYDDSLAAATEAIEEYRRIGDRLRGGDALRIRSDVGWCPGYIAASTRDARDAVSLLETIPPTRELGYAYANLGALHKDAEEREAAKLWAARAIQLGHELGVHDVVIRATTDIGSVEILEGAPEGLARLEGALASAWEAGFVEQVGRIYVSMHGPASATRNYAITERHLAAGLEHCSNHGLELYRLYLLAYAARVALDTGRWDDAASGAQAVLRVPRSSTTPRILALAALALVRARRGDPEVQPLIEEAWALAEPTGELPRIGPVAVARAEAAWLTGRPHEIVEATEAALELAVSRQSTWRLGELLSWRRRAGVRDEVALQLRGPFSAQIAGEHLEAAKQWTQLGCPYEAALALADADQEEPLRRALEKLQQLEARAAATTVARRLRELGVRGVSRGPRPSTRANPAALTAREIDVLCLLAQGLRNSGIGERLFVSPRTVEHHVSAILGKLGVQSRGEAVAEARRLGLLLPAS